VNPLSLFAVEATNRDCVRVSEADDLRLGYGDARALGERASP